MANKLKITCIKKHRCTEIELDPVYFGVEMFEENLAGAQIGATFSLRQV